MTSKRLRAFMTILAVVIAAGWLMQVAMTPAPASGEKVKVTGTVADKIVSRFPAAGLGGVRSIEYRRLVMSPGSRREGEMHFDDHLELCVAVKGSITVTLADGTKQTFKAGDVFIIPLGTTRKVVTADAKMGYEELYWKITTTAHK